MNDETPRPAAATNDPADPPTPQAAVEETLIEEISIDGMCGVY